MKLYTLINHEGKYYRSIGYGGSGGNWVDTLEKAKFYPKIGQAKGRVTFFYNYDKKFPCPQILEFDLSNPVVIDAVEETKKRILKAEERDAKKQEARQREKLVEAEKEHQRLKHKIAQIKKQLEPKLGECTCSPCPEGRDDMFWREDEELACERRADRVAGKPVKVIHS